MRPYRPAKQTPKQSPPQLSVLPVPDLNDVDALLSKPRFSKDASFDPDPRFQLFEQNSVYDKLPGSYVDQPLGSFYPNALNTELKHTLSEAWRFNPVALSIRGARETAFELARTPGHGLDKELISWVKTIGLSRMQAQSRERQADDVAAKECLLYEHYAELHDEDPSTLMDAGTLQKELDDFYHPPIGEANSKNLFDYRHYHNASGAPPSPSAELHPVKGIEVDKSLKGLDINTTPSSLPARRGWLGGIPAPVATTEPFKRSVGRVDHGYGAASLPTPDAGIKCTAANPSNGPTVARASLMISPPLTAAIVTPASHNCYGVMIPAGHPTPSDTQLNMTCSSSNSAIPIAQASHQNHVFLAKANMPTFEAKLAPLGTPKQPGRRLALFENGGEIDWEGRQIGPYDFSDFCSSSRESDHSDLSDGSEHTANAGATDGAGRHDTAMPDTMGIDGAASPEIPVPDAHDFEGAIFHENIMSDDATDEVATIASTSEAPASAANQYSYSRLKSVEGGVKGEIASGHMIQQRTPGAVEDIPNKPMTPEGIPEQAMHLAQDLEQSIHSAVCQTTTLARVLGYPAPLFLPEPAVAVPKLHDLQKHSGRPETLNQPQNKQIQAENTLEHDKRKDPQTQPIIGPVQTNNIGQEPHQLRVNTFTIPVPRRVQNIQSANLPKPKTIRFMPEYNSDCIDDGKAHPDNLSAGVLSSPTNKTQGGKNALSHYVRETTSHPTLAAHESINITFNDADSTIYEPEDLALTPTNAEFDHDHLTPSDPLEEVSLIEESLTTTISSQKLGNTPSPALKALQQVHTPNMTSAYSPYLDAFSPTSSAYHAPAAAPALTTPNNDSSPTHHPRTPFQLSTAARALVLPPTTLGTPTPAQKVSDQHHPKKASGGALLRHKHLCVEKKMRKSVKSVFESKELGSRSSSPVKEAGSEDGGFGGRKFVVETGQGMKRTTSSPANVVPPGPAPMAMMARTRSQDGATMCTAQAEGGMVRTKSQDQVAQAVVVSDKRKQITGHDVVHEGVGVNRVQKKLRRSTRTIEHDVTKKTHGEFMP